MSLLAHRLSDIIRCYLCLEGSTFPTDDTQSMYDHITTWHNLYDAWHKAKQRKRSQPNVATFEHRLEDHLWELHHELTTQTYTPRGYTSFVIHEPKRRVISAAPFRDRVVHHALCNIIEPLFERTFITHSYANRIGKGTHRALDRCQQLARQYRYVLQCDVRQFFPSIDHAILREHLTRAIPDTDVMHLIDLVLASGEDVLRDEYEMVWFTGDDLLAHSRPRGLPIGNLTSQFWANVTLNPLDQYIKRTLRCKGYVRYVDDFLLFADDKQTLWVWHSAIVERLAQLRLTLHPHAHPRPVTEGIPFLGFVVYPTHRRLKRRKGIEFERRLRGNIEAYERGEITLDELTATVKGWVNHVRYGNTVGLRKAILRAHPIPPRIEK